MSNTRRISLFITVIFFVSGYLFVSCNAKRPVQETDSINENNNGSVQTSIAASTGRIVGSNIVLINISKSDLDKIMQGSIFDVFTLELKATDYNTDLKKSAFLETKEGKEYQTRLDTLRNRLRSEGIRIITKSESETTRDYITTISDYDVSKGGFTIKINYNSWNVSPNPLNPRENIPDRNYWSNNINGFAIPNKQNEFFMPVPRNAAEKIEGNNKVAVQLQLNVNSFAIQKIFLVNVDTNEVYAEMTY